MGDHVDVDSILRELLACAESWVPDCRLFGNVRAGDIVIALRTVLAERKKDSDLRTNRLLVEMEALKAELSNTKALYESEIETILKDKANMLRVIGKLYEERDSLEIEIEKYRRALRDIQNHLAKYYPGMGPTIVVLEIAGEALKEKK